MQFSKRIKVLFFTLSLTVFTACSYHIYTKKEVVKVAKKNADRKDMRIVVEDSGSILKVLVRDSNYRKLDEIYQFDENGKQLKFTLIASCDSCFKKNLLALVTSHDYKWQKLNDSTYLSRYSLKRILDVHKSAYTYEIVPHKYSRKAYEALLKNVVQ